MLWHSLCFLIGLIFFLVGKVIKKSIKFFLILAVVVLSIPTSIWLVIQHSSVQTWLVSQTTEMLENKLGTKVHIEKFDFRLFNRVLLRNVYFEDHNHDTLLNAKTLKASLLGYNRSKNNINFHRVTLDDAIINLETDSLGQMNLTVFINKLMPPRDTLKPKDDNGMGISFRHVKVASSEFRMQKQNADTAENQINFDDLKVTGLNLNLKNFSITGDTIAFTIDELTGIDKSGFAIDRFRTEMSLSSKHMHFDKLRIRAMGSSINLPYLRLSYNNWDDMSDFLNTVDLRGEIQTSALSTKALSFFVPTVTRFDETVDIEGRFRGTISDLRVRDLSLKVADTTSILANINLSGLPNFSSTFIFVDIKQLITTDSDLEKFTYADTKQRIISIPDNLYNLNELSFAGNFTGFISDFVAYGTLETDIGNISMDLLIKPDQQASTAFKGNVSTNELNLGKLLNNEILGKISLSAVVNGNTDYNTQFNATTDATIYSLEANRYKYSNIELAGTLNNKTFEGSMLLDDPNAKLNFLGSLNFSDSIPVFDFSAFVPKLDLVKLNLNKVDSLSQASFLVTAKFSGSNIDNTSGEIKLVNGLYRNQNGEIKTADIIVTADNSEDSKQIAFKSEFAEGELRGKYNYTKIFSHLQNMIYLYLPALSSDNTKPKITPTGVENPEYNDYIIRLRLKNTNKITSVLFPSFRIADNTNVFGIYNPDFQTLNLKVKIPQIELAGNLIKDISINGQTNDSTLTASINTPTVTFGSSNIRNVAINIAAKNNNLETNIHWDNKTDIKNNGEIKTNALFTHRPEGNLIDFQFISSDFILNDTTWHISPSEIRIDSTSIAINNFLLYNNLQTLAIQGKIASALDDFIQIDLQNINVSYLNLYTKDLGYEFQGQANGNARATNLSENPLFYADLTLDNLVANDYKMGKITLNSQWNNDEKKLSVDLLNTLDDQQGLSLAGDFFPDTKSIRFFGRLNNIAIGLVEPFLEGNVTDLRGSVSGNINLTGTTDTPLLNGTLRVNEASGLIDFTKTRYSMSDPIYLENSDVVFRNFKIYDTNNRLATLNGTITTNHFKDIALDLNITPSNFQFLNTAERDNEQFYGTVYASGQARVTGPPNDITVNASVKTEPRTALFLPLSTSSDVAEFDFVNFVNRSDDIIIIEDFLGLNEQQKSNVKVMLDLEVTPEADVQIIIDKQLGDIIRANGSGNLKLEVDLKEDIFNMFGQFNIEKGDYLFTLQGVINKRFRIGDGSTITWNGDITGALMDIKAIYSLRTTLKPLNPTSEEAVYNSRTQVDCIINLSGKLMEPTIGFDILVPIAENDPALKAVVLDALNTEERVSMHFLSLLVINSFTNDNPLAQGTGVSQGLASTAGEMLSNQLSNWMSQWTNAVDIGVNWRPGDEMSSNEIEVALSTQILNDRVTINGNVDMGNQNVSTGIAGDVSIDVKIVPSGKLRLKAFARSNDEILYGTNSGEFTTGAGVMYREDFNNLGELLNRYKNALTRRKDPETEFEYIESDFEENTNSKPINAIDKDQNVFVEIK